MCIPGFGLVNQPIPSVFADDLPFIIKKINQGMAICTNHSQISRLFTVLFLSPLSELIHYLYFGAYSLLSAWTILSLFGNF